jgi:lambda family phage portal protein
MKLLDSVLPWRRHIRRLESQIANLQTRNFSGAQSNRLTADWPTSGASLDSILRNELPTLRQRSKEMSHNNEYFSAFLNMLGRNVVGSDGIALKNKAADPPTFKDGKIIPGPLDFLANKLVEDHWYEWGKKKNCTVAKTLTWLECQHLAIRGVGTVGATLWQKIYGSAAGNKYGFAIQPLEIDRIDHALNRRLPNGGTIKMGIQRDALGRLEAIWLHDSDPTDSFFGSYGSKPYPASDFIHCYMMLEIGQTQGFPWAAASMLRAKMLQGFDEAHLEGARAAACKMGFLTKTGTNAEYVGENAEGGGKYMDAEPGALEELPQGMDIKTVDWGFPSPQYDQFIKACLRGMAAGLNVSYPTLANDYGEVNFSSGRMAQLEERDFWKMCQAWFINHFHNEVFEAWLDAALLSGAISLDLPSGRKITLPHSRKDKFCQPNWHGRRWTWVDPQKELAAKETELRNYITSPTRVLAEIGADEDEVLDESQAFLEKVANRKLPLPAWAQPVNGTAEPEPEEEKPEKPDKAE